MDFENANVDIWGLTHQSCSTCDGIVMPGWMHLFTGCAFSSIVSFLYLKLRVDLMWVKIIIIGGQWKGRVCNKPKSWANREKNMSVSYLSEDKRISIKPYSWATESEEVVQTASCDYISSRVGLPKRRERTHTNSVSESGRGRVRWWGSPQAVYSL